MVAAEYNPVVERMEVVEVDTEKCSVEVWQAHYQDLSMVPLWTSLIEAMQQCTVHYLHTMVSFIVLCPGKIYKASFHFFYLNSVQEI